MHGSRLILASAGVGVALLTAGTASADGPVEFKSRLGDLCLDASAGDWLNPALVNPCNGTDFQRWNLDPDGRIESVAFPGRCLQPQEDGWTVHLAACWDSQRWTVRPNGQIAAFWGPCLTAGNAAPGTRVSTRLCNGAPNQGWDSVP